ncbi:MAG: hypothetical protein Q4D02_00175 [Clostridia bacterium]|nr:hypothetical protein [Clostridia bacterium]
MEKTLRTKTLKALTAQAEIINMNAEELISSVENAISNFLTLEEDKAYELMLRLKITPRKSETEEEGEKKTGIFLEDVMKEAGIENVGVENLQKVCGDMAAAYKEAHPRCWLAQKEDYPEELRKALDDPTILHLIDDRCKAASYLAEDSVQRIMFLITSTEEKFRFGGLRAMFFTKEEAAALKDFANNIASYFTSFVEGKLKRTSESKPASELTEERSELNLAGELPEARSELNPAGELPEARSELKPAGELPVIEPTAQQIQTTAFTAVQILSNAELINNFFAAYAALKEAGIEPEAAMLKKDSIQKLLNAATEL